MAWHDPLRTLTAAVAAATALVLPATAAAGTPGATATAAPGAPPSSMTALGDSITQAATTCDWQASCPENSWASGTTKAVNSHYRRILSVNQAIRGRDYNDAVSGAVSADLPGQAGWAVARGVDYVTIEIGANDACADTPEQMTSASTYRAAVDRALDRINTGLPAARILVASVPNLYRVWQVGHTDAASVAYWNTSGICQSMLANPTSTAAADETRRQAVLQRIRDYNTQLAESCTAHAGCRFDGNAVFNWQFSAGDLSWDTFHPNIDGQNKLAAVTYPVYGW